MCRHGSASFLLQLSLCFPGGPCQEVLPHCEGSAVRCEAVLRVAFATCLQEAGIPTKHLPSGLVSDDWTGTIFSQCITISGQYRHQPAKAKYRSAAEQAAAAGLGDVNAGEASLARLCSVRSCCAFAAGMHCLVQLPDMRSSEPGR